MTPVLWLCSVAIAVMLVVLGKWIWLAIQLVGFEPEEIDIEEGGWSQNGFEADM